jgi:hypothetical protein
VSAFAQFRGRVAFVAVVLAAALLAPPAHAAGPPVVGAVSATNIQAVSALLIAAVNPEGLSASGHFEYVDQATFAADQPSGFARAKRTAEVGLGSGTQERTATAAIAGLTRETAYRYRFVARNSAGSVQGPTQAFTTSQGFGFLPGDEGFEVGATDASGSVANEAGSHPYALSTEVNFNLGGEFAGQPGVPFTDGDLRNLRLELAPGTIENPMVVTQCRLTQFYAPRDSPFQESLSGESCPDKSQVGLVTVRSSYGGGTARTFGVFNLEPEPGSPAQIGFNPYGMPVVLERQIDSSGGEYRLALETRNVPQLLNISGLKMTLWGNPWLVGHDLERGDCLNEVDPDNGFGVAAVLRPEPPVEGPPYQAGTCSIGNPEVERPHAYLTLPNSCAKSVPFSVSASSWQQPAVVTRSQSIGLGGCDLDGFETVASAKPSTDRSSSASGLNFSLDLSQGGLLNNVTDRGRLKPGVRAPSQMKTATVTLPEGMTVNPSVAAGLGVCTRAQYAAETAASAPGEGCPNPSKIGEFQVESQLLERPLTGGLFLAQPDDSASPGPGAENPFDSLLALYIVAKDPERGIMIKVAGKVTPDPASGRLVARFDELPQLPYAHFSVRFREGQRSPLATPPACGSYTTRIDLNPWLAPGLAFGNNVFFSLDKGIGGGPCPSGVPRFAPAANSGTLNRNTGSYSPFYLHLTRTDADQEITSYSATLPPGLLGRIAGVPFCPEAAIAAAARNGGFAETANPSCPEASRIGKTTAGYGLGNVLAYAPGNLYLAGPYHGSPLSVVAVDSATVGPFDLGVIIVRSAIRVDPQTAQVSIDSAGSDPIPHIIKGIPLHLRDIRVYIDRPNFMVNPTSCEGFNTTSTLNGSGAVFSNPADDSLAAVANPFQVSFCSSLGFKPRMDLRLGGSTRRGGFPSLKATVTPRPGNANIGAAAVTLPPSLFLEQGHIDTICTRAQSVASKCPPGSIYGKARAVTPLMDEPLEGPVYLRASNNKLPDLVAALTGRGIRIDVVGRIDAKNGGMRATYDVLPDAPVSKFSLTLKGGKRGLLANSDNACKEFAGTARILGQNNKGAVLKPSAINPKCKKLKAKKKKSAKHGKKKGSK